MKKAFKTILFTTLTLAMVFSIIPAIVQARANSIFIGAMYGDNPSKIMEGIEFGLFNGELLIDSQSLGQFGSVAFSWDGPMENLTIRVLDTRGYFTERLSITSSELVEVPGVLPFFHYDWYFTSAVPVQTAEVTELRVQTAYMSDSGEVHMIGNIQLGLYNNGVRVDVKTAPEGFDPLVFEWTGSVEGLDVRLLDSDGLSSEYSIVPFQQFRRISEFANIWLFNWTFTSAVEEVAPFEPAPIVSTLPAPPITTPVVRPPMGTTLQVEGNRLLVNNQQVGTIRTYAGQQLFPLRSTAEALGATVIWQPNGTVLVTTADGYPTVLTVGSYQIFDERAYVPRNFFAVMLRTNIVG